MRYSSNTMTLALTVVVGAVTLGALSGMSFAQDTTQGATAPSATAVPSSPDVMIGMPTGATQGASDAAKTPSLGMTNDVASIKEEDLPPEIKILRKIEADLKKRDKQKINYERSTIPSLVFTSQQYALLREARIGFNTRIPTMQELKDPGDPNDPNYHRGFIPRDVVLGGIAYISPDDWTIWLNNARITPDAIPAEVIDVKVFKDFIELRWYDIKTDQIFPIRLRSNQKFNLDSRIFLPS